MNVHDYNYDQGYWDGYLACVQDDTFWYIVCLGVGFLVGAVVL